MSFSHRDLRAHREVGRLVVVVGLGLGGLILLAVVAPLPVAGALAVIALAVLGGFAVVRGDALVRRYEADLRAIRPDNVDRLGALGVEVHNAVPLHPPASSPTRRSPHVRPPSRRRAGAELAVGRPDPAP